MYHYAPARARPQYAPAAKNKNHTDNTPTVTTTIIRNPGGHSPSSSAVCEPMKQDANTTLNTDQSNHMPCMYLAATRRASTYTATRR